MAARPRRRDATSLKITHLQAGYARKQVLFDVSLTLDAGAIGLIIGPNGAGKSTLLKGIFGLCRVMAGSVEFEGKTVTARTSHENVLSGISLVPQGGRVFPNLTVEENLRLGAYTIRDWAVVRTRLAMVYDLFGRLAERRRQDAQSLSGGERQMLSLGRALMVAPRLLLLDEPSLGLSPAAIEQSLGVVQDINRNLGTTILVVEQNVLQGLRIAGRVFVLRDGRSVAEVTPADLRVSEDLRKVFLDV